MQLAVGRDGFDRPFPFNLQVKESYASGWWESRTGVGELAQVLFLKERSLLLMLAFYGDGSGEHGNGPMVVAGYLGHTVDLFDLETKWCRELHAAPRIEYFKASECKPEQPAKLSGQFAGWDPLRAEEKRGRLARIVRDASPRLAALSSMVQWDEYHSAIGDGFVKDVFYHPYFFCFHGITTLAIQYSEIFEQDQNNKRVAFLFDTESNGTVDQDAQIQYGLALAKSSIPQKVKARMGSVTWDTDIRFPVLQIADLLAWSIRRKALGLPSPVLNLVRDPNRLAGCNERNANTAAIAQFVVELDVKAESVQSQEQVE